MYFFYYHSSGCVSENVYVYFFIYSFISLFFISLHPSLSLHFTCLFAAAALQFHAGLLLFFQSHLCVRLDDNGDGSDDSGADDGDLGILFSIEIGHSWICAE